MCDYTLLNSSVNYRILRSNANVIGRQWVAQLTLLRSYHREHGNFGNRYIEVIHELTPVYAPRTDAQLAQRRACPW